MPHSKIRVLLDLSMARRGYCGIAQDVRLLYKTLASCPEIELTGLVYRPHKFARPHRFSGPRVTRAARAANQAEFLWKLAEASVNWSPHRPIRMWEQMWAVGDTLAARHAQLDPLDAEKFWPSLWRLLFSQTLSAADIPLVQQGRFLLSNLSDGKVFARTFSRRRPISLDTRGYDFLIVQGPRAFRTSPGTRQIVRYHDMIPVLEPDTMGNPLVISWHNLAIRENRQAYFVCNSEPTRDDLTQVHPQLADRSSTIPYMLSDVYRPQTNAAALQTIIQTRRSHISGGSSPCGPNPQYIMTVSTLEPRKNFVALIQAFSQLKSQSYARDLKLIIVGSPGWRFEPILNAMRGLAARGDLIHLEGVSSEELRVLYSHAQAFVFPSTAEGFGFPPLEAMSCGAAVVASDLPAHRWVLGDAATYCDPLQVSSIAAAIERLVRPDAAPGLRQELIAAGYERVRRFTQERCGRQWLDLLSALREQAQPASKTMLSSSDRSARPLQVA